MKPTLQVEVRGFNEVLKEIAKQSSREAVDVVNGRLLAVIIKALKFTEKANAQQIAADLGQVGNQFRYTRTGRVKRGQMILREDSFAARIVNARRRDYAGPDYMLWGNALDEAARKLIASRMRSVAFIKSGWIWALRQLAPLVKFGRKSNPDKDARAIGQPKGSALPSRPNARGIFTASAENTALIAGGGKNQAPGPHNPLPVAERGLRKAFEDEKFEMERHLKRKFMEAAKRAGAQVR